MQLLFMHRLSQVHAQINGFGHGINCIIYLKMFIQNEDNLQLRFHISKQINMLHAAGTFNMWCLSSGGDDSHDVRGSKGTSTQVTPLYDEAYSSASVRHSETKRLSVLKCSCSLHRLPRVGSMTMWVTRDLQIRGSRVEQSDFLNPNFHISQMTIIHIEFISFTIILLAILSVSVSTTETLL